MSQGRTASALYTIKNGVYPVVRFGVVRSPHSTESSSSTQCVIDSFKDHTNGFDAAHEKTICSLDLTVSLRVIDRSVIELDAHVAAPKFYLVGCKVRAVIGDDAVGTP